MDWFEELTGARAAELAASDPGTPTTEPETPAAARPGAPVREPRAWKLPARDPGLSPQERGRATTGATAGATHGATAGATHGATAGATHGATAGATHGATAGATHGATKATPARGGGRRRALASGAALGLVGVVAAVALAAGTILVPAAKASPTASPSRMAVATAQPTPSPSPTPRPTGTVINVGPTPAPTPQRPAPVDKLTGYVWPLDDANGFQVTLPYGPSEWGEFMVGGKLFHDGVDMATICWDKVYAVHDGVVLTAGRDYVDYMGWQGDTTKFKKRFATASWKATLPIVVVIDNGDGYRSIYAHELKVTVKAGQRVKAGQVIGYEGATGNATGCHLHFGLYSPLETATFDNLYKYTVYPDRLPTKITARVDPLLILPYRNDVIEMRTLRPADAAAWASAHPKATPTAKH